MFHACGVHVVEYDTDTTKRVCRRVFVFMHASVQLCCSVCLVACSSVCMYVDVCKSGCECNISPSISVCVQRRADSWHNWDSVFLHSDLCGNSQTEQQQLVQLPQVPVTMGYSVTMDTLFSIANSFSCHVNAHTFPHSNIFSKTSYL